VPGSATSAAAAARNAVNSRISDDYEAAFRRALSSTRNAAALQSSLASAERVFAVLDQTPEVPQATRPRRLDRARGAIAFDNVSFGYERGEQLLDRVSFELPAGSCLGIAGPTGIGKTTLVSLLPRLHDPLSGRVLLDGHDVRDYRLDDLRRQFAFVFQDPAIFAGTVAENVALGASSARGDEIDAALAAASASTLVARLPHGRDTILGERGLHLSAGERQRLALARAFVRNSPVLVLDEPTNSLDPATEAAILATLDELSGRRTTIMVAHRLVTLRMCDLVLELANDGTATLIRDVAGWLAEHQRGLPQQLHATA
jgi:ABC-type multidrug transport system fused ATPase/permease subunit